MSSRVELEKPSANNSAAAETPAPCSSASAALDCRFLLDLSFFYLMPRLFPLPISTVRSLESGAVVFGYRPPLNSLCGTLDYSEEFDTESEEEEEALNNFRVKSLLSADVGSCRGKMLS